MPEQLVLVDTPDSDFRLDRHTRELGLRGVAAARRILAEAARITAEREAELGHAA